MLRRALALRPPPNEILARVEKFPLVLDSGLAFHSIHPLTLGMLPALHERGDGKRMSNRPITNHESRIRLAVIMRVAEIMTTHVRTIGPADSAELAWDRMAAAAK
jgi:hypothetical protein